nr:TIR [Medicago truncatula]
MSYSDHGYKYDVFINFRGEDTRRTIVSHLYTALCNAGINTFLDDKKLAKGEELGPELYTAIKMSHIFIAVFSPNYAQSSWCLNELAHIMELRHRRHSYSPRVVIPLFYHVDPSDVRKLKGDFGKGLKVSADKIFSQSGAEREEVLMSKWRRALAEVTNLVGWDANNFRNEGDLVQKLVEDILTKLDMSVLSITEFPVGLEPRVQSITKILYDESRKACMIGLWGMGGSGKTTLAKAIYNRIHREFQGKTSFIESIREVCDYNRKGIIHLQEQLLSDLLKTKDKIHSIAVGINKIEKRLQGQKVLIVLDDVTKSEQLKALGGNPKLFGSGSVLIITTRDRSHLDSLSARVFTMIEMDKNESLELFSWHAFRQSCPRKDFGKLSRNVVSYCKGLPLALEVLGSYLSKRTEQEWRSALSKLTKIPNNEVLQILRISYDGLEDYTEKDIFLDICCFFIGKNRVDVTEILNGCGLHADIGVSVLIERSLIKVDKNNKFQMHDLLRDMGRAIVSESSAKEPEKHSRLWCHEDVLDVLSKKTGTKTVEGLILKWQRTGRICFGTNAFQEMEKLRLLKLDGVDLIGDYGLISKQLRWVDWQRSTFTFIPNDFDQANLVVFELKYSNVKQVWQDTKLLEKLKVLKLSHSKYLKSSPDFSKLPNLEKLVMKDCQSLSNVHPSIGDLKNLLLINLKDCIILENLPREIYQLKSVKTLILTGCSTIDKLEEDIVQMESLTSLITTGTSIKEVPYSILRLRSIVYISICGYEGLSHEVFPSLIRFWMSPTINSLPRIPPFGGMPLSLVSLDLENNNNNNNNNLSCLVPKLNSFSELRSFRVQCQSMIQLTRELRRFLDDLYDANFTELETSHTSQISVLSLRSLLIGMGSYHTVINTLGKSISQELRTNDSVDYFLPGDNYPSWLTYRCVGPSVYFEVPNGGVCGLNGITLCVVYSSTLENIGTECLTSVLIINHTKFTIHICKRDTVMSFNDEDWQGVVSNLGVGDNVEIFVTFRHGLTVKETAVYLIYSQSSTREIESILEVEAEPTPEVEAQSSTDVKAEPSPE